MNRQQNVLDKTMSLHDIKNMMQLTFAEQHADFIANNLEALIENTYRDAPVRQNRYTLTRNDDRDLTPSINRQEKHWEEAIFRKWRNDDNGLDPRVPFRKILCYQVMLRDTNKNRGWGELDLLGATAENVPIAIELKIKPSEYLLKAIVEILAYGVAIRKAWNEDGCLLRWQWADEFDKDDDLVDLPLAVMAPSTYWKVVFSDSPERIGFQTPQHVLQSIKKLLEKMHRVHYPLTLVAVREKHPPEKSGLPVIINAFVKDIPNPTGSW